MSDLARYSRADLETMYVGACVAGDALRAELAEKAAAIWEQRCSQATALSGEHLEELAAARRERDAFKEALRELAGAASGDMGIQCADAVYQRLNRAIAAARAALENADG